MDGYEAKSAWILFSYSIHAHFIFFRKAVFMDSITPAEMQAIRAYHNARNRAWWASQSSEERRARRQRYALNAIRRQQAAAERENENKKYETRSKRRGKE
jgi:hypothetical protein